MKEARKKRFNRMHRRTFSRKEIDAIKKSLYALESKHGLLKKGKDFGDSDTEEKGASSSSSNSEDEEVGALGGINPNHLRMGNGNDARSEPRTRESYVSPTKRC